MIDGAKFISAAGLVLLALASHGAYPADPEKPGVERWAVKTSLLKGQTATELILLPELLALGAVPGVAKNDAHYQKDRILESGLQHVARSGAAVVYLEGALLRTQGWLHLVALEHDGDYHIQISESRASQARCLVVEVPKPDPLFVADTTLHPIFRQVRDFVKTSLLRGQEPSRGGSLLRSPAFVEVEGALFYDDAHVGDPPRGKRGCRSPTLWELHPVTAIRFVRP